MVDRRYILTIFVSIPLVSKCHSVIAGGGVAEGGQGGRRVGEEGGKGERQRAQQGPKLKSGFLPLKRFFCGT